MDDYADRQSARDKEYLDAWKNLSPRQRKQLEKAGITGPDVPSYRMCRMDDTAAIEKIAARDCGANLKDPDAFDPEPCVREAGELLKVFLFRIIDEAKNPRLEAECISLAFGYGAAKGTSQTAVAARYGVTRAAVSKRVREIRDVFGLPVSEFMKSDHARAVYALTNKPRL